MVLMKKFAVILILVSLSFGVVRWGVSDSLYTSVYLPAPACSTIMAVDFNYV